MGVHYADLWLYFLGPVVRIAGHVALFEPVRHGEAPRGMMATYYGTAGTSEPVQATAEDTAAGQVLFADGAIGQWLMCVAGHGEGFFTRRFYGSAGALDAPSDRSGRPLRLARAGQGAFQTLDDAAIRALVPEFCLDEPTTRLFCASQLASYDLPGEVIDRKLLALELEDFGRAILDRRAPEVDGHGGLAAVALVHAFFESSLAGREVTLVEVTGGAVEAYQHEIDAALGLTEEGILA
jgi:predicted dehydrogenase